MQTVRPTLYHRIFSSNTSVSLLYICPSLRTENLSTVIGIRELWPSYMCIRLHILVESISWFWIFSTSSLLGIFILENLLAVLFLGIFEDDFVRLNLFYCVISTILPTSECRSNLNNKAASCDAVYPLISFALNLMQFWRI